MEEMLSELPVILQVFLYLLSCAFLSGGVYVAIRKDLQHMREKIEDNKERTRDAKLSADSAHDRIDRLLTSRKYLTMRSEELG